MVLIFVVGLIAGSFLNVVIYRLKSGDPLGFSRSFCPYCRAQLKWFDLIPIFSFIWLKSRCRYCSEKISWQYPVVEILSGIIWISIFYPPPFALQRVGGFGAITSFYHIFILSSLLVIAVYDFKWKIISNKIVYPAIVAVFLFNFLNVFSSYGGSALGGKFLNIEIFISSLFVASVAFLFFFLIYFFSKGRAMGLGDAKLAFLIGLFLVPISAVIAFALAFVFGAVIGIILIMISKIPHPLVYKGWGMKSQIAFGPFLVFSAFFSFFFSDFIIKFFQP